MLQVQFQIYGDGCRRDKDGYYWITGRVDDVINVSGHRIGTAEIESSLVLHSNVSEAASISIPDELTGEAIVVFFVSNDKNDVDLIFTDLQHNPHKKLEKLQNPNKFFNYLIYQKHAQVKLCADY